MTEYNFPTVKLETNENGKFFLATGTYSLMTSNEEPTEFYNVSQYFVNMGDYYKEVSFEEFECLQGNVEYALENSAKYVVLLHLLTL